MIPYFRTCNVFISLAVASVLCEADEREAVRFPEAMMLMSVNAAAHCDTPSTLAALVQERDCRELAQLPGVDPVVR